MRHLSQQSQLHVPRLNQADEIGEERGSQKVLLSDVRRKAEPSPAQARVEVTIHVDVTGTPDYAQVARRMAHVEEDAQDRAARLARRSLEHSASSRSRWTNTRTETRQNIGLVGFLSIWSSKA